MVVDLFQTDTADFADFVLPAASFLEFDDLVVLLLQPDALGAGAGHAARGRGAAEPGDLPPARARDGLRRARAVRERRARSSTASAESCGIERRLRGARARRHGRASRPEPVRRSSPTASSRRPPARSRSPRAAAARDGHPRVPQPHADPRPADGPLPPALAGLRLADELELRQRPADRRARTAPRA